MVEDRASLIMQRLSRICKANRNTVMYVVPVRADPLGVFYDQTKRPPQWEVILSQTGQRTVSSWNSRSGSGNPVDIGGETLLTR